MQTQPQDATQSRFRKTLHQALRVFGYPPLDDADDEVDARPRAAAVTTKRRATIVWDRRRPREKRQVSLSAESMLDI